MKNLILLSCLLIATIATAQTPFTMVASSNTKNQPAKISANSLNNPWVGAKLAYNLAGDVSNSFLLSGRVMYSIDEGDKYAIPLIANVGFNNIDSLDADNGVSIGCYPWYILSQKNNTTVLVHGGVNYHVGAKAEYGYLTEVNLIAGIEAALYPKDGGAPATISAGPEYIINTGGYLQNQFAINITGVVPIANGLGLLVESDIPLIKSQVSTGVKIGVIVNNSIK
jgi:hypothetical protein